MKTKSITALLTLTFTLMLAGTAEAQLQDVGGTWMLITDVDCDGEIDMRSYMALDYENSTDLHGSGTIHANVIPYGEENWCYSRDIRACRVEEPFAIISRGNATVGDYGEVRVDAMYIGHIDRSGPLPVLRGNGHFYINREYHTMCWQTTYRAVQPPAN